EFRRVLYRSALPLLLVRARLHDEGDGAFAEAIAAIFDPNAADALHRSEIELEPRLSLFVGVEEEVRALVAFLQRRFARGDGIGGARAHRFAGRQILRRFGSNAN